ncbi:MAG: rod shape-determining protein [Planctomycetes bacterium]|jgi:rod shape-determining protein MreB|nr:rod shape-determining protein [Planctomycetota bacterium]HNZ66545.1 rod shape-determining protein [Planctomycetota bacterium]HPY75840.1 rod shape-determining protein [Planctomycetota bacterium]HQB01409.1 rod shape-determining protein [Planctomycetota bacterium]HRU52364.1 rod shape-determining protein [Planctomycetota bacterium]
MANIFESIHRLFSQDMGIDLGTANTLVCIQGEGIILSEPSVVAVSKYTNEVFNNAVGEVAKVMLGKCPANIMAVRPLKHGVIADFAVTEAMLKYFIKKAQRRKFATKPRVVISIPSGITSVEKQAVIDSALRAGALQVFLIEEPIAAGLGAGLPITEPYGSMIVDIGGGTTEVAVLSLGGCVASESVRVAGDDLDNAIVQYIKKTYNLLIGEQTAERIKKEIGSAYELEEELTLEIHGRDLQAMLPRSTEVHSEEIRQALIEPVSQILQAIKATLEKVPPQLAADLVDQGITLAGGGALLRGLDRMIQRETDLCVRVAPEPLYSVARGTLEVLNQLELLLPVLCSG